MKTTHSSAIPSLLALLLVSPGATAQFDFANSVGDPCNYALSGTGAVHTAAPQTGTFTITTGTNCPWFVRSSNFWWGRFDPLFGSGTTTVTYSLEVNPATEPRSVRLSIGDQTFVLTQLGISPDCTFSLDPTGRVHNSSTTYATVKVNTQPGCEWNAYNTNRWIGIAAMDRTTNGGTVTYYVLYNGPNAPRTGYLNIAGQPFTINQVNCTFSIVSHSESYGTGAATDSVALATSSPCPWTVSTADRWITLLTPTNNVGPAIVSWRIDPNPSPLGRSGLILIGENNFWIHQAGTFTNRIVGLGDALDAGDSFAWDTWGDENASWFGQTLVTHDGVDAARSGAVAGGASTLQTVVAGPGMLHFWWKVSSEAGKDFLRFLVNDVEQARISGEYDWHQRSFRVPAGPNELKWIYSKDETGAAGQDLGWVDQVRYLPMHHGPPGTRPRIHIEPATHGRGPMIWGEGESGTAYVVECSADLVHWTPINTNSLPFAIVDSAPTAAPQRFYRVRQVSP